jgi:ubiquitin carboxyl-terminal hydrolase 7
MSRSVLRNSVHVAIPLIVAVALLHELPWVQAQSSEPSTCAAVSHSPQQRRLVGLENLGNTCYLNAQLQCAYHIPLVRSYVLNSRPPDRGPVDNDSVEDDSPALWALRRVFGDLQSSSGTTEQAVSVSPRILCQTLDIPVFEQQDSQEFWKLLLPALQLPALNDLYTGTYENYIEALDGSGRERCWAEPFLDLSLSLFESSYSSSDGQQRPHSSVLSSLRQQFATPELLSVAEGNAWRPEPNAELVDARKGYRLMSAGLPPILQLHLNRFRFDWSTETTTKVNTALTFPSLLDLREVMDHNAHDVTPDEASSDNACTYELQAVLVHTGEHNSGHYYAYVRPDIRTNDWYRFNDATVTKVDFAQVQQDAYGGQQQQPSSSHQRTGTGQEFKAEPRPGNFLTRFLRPFFGSSGNENMDGYGFGGPTGNAYVLQYVRRCDIPRLYDLE